ncbi:AgrD family cyclic lactone autoinducer peptide [Paenibacillus sp. FSL H3-0286]
MKKVSLKAITGLGALLSFIAVVETTTTASWLWLGKESVPQSMKK